MILVERNYNYTMPITWDDFVLGEGVIVGETNAMFIVHYFSPHEPTQEKRLRFRKEDCGMRYMSYHICKIIKYFDGYKVALRKNSKRFERYFSPKAMGKKP